jgi:hypothetical protein
MYRSSIEREEHTESESAILKNQGRQPSSLSDGYGRDPLEILK